MVLYLGAQASIVFAFHFLTKVVHFAEILTFFEYTRPVVFSVSPGRHSVEAGHHDGDHQDKEDG